MAFRGWGMGRGAERVEPERLVSTFMARSVARSAFSPFPPKQDGLAGGEGCPLTPSLIRTPVTTPCGADALKGRRGYFIWGHGSKAVTVFDDDGAQRNDWGQSFFLGGGVSQCECDYIFINCFTQKQVVDVERAVHLGTYWHQTIVTYINSLLG